MADKEHGHEHEHDPPHKDQTWDADAKEEEEKKDDDSGWKPDIDKKKKVPEEDPGWKGNPDKDKHKGDPGWQGNKDKGKKDGETDKDKQKPSEGGKKDTGTPKTPEFPPLSQEQVAPGVTMPPSNPVDSVELEKSSHIPAVQLEEGCIVEKDLTQVLCETEQIIYYGFAYVRHLNAMTLELKLLLEYEKKILEQVMVRIDKFKVLRDENKRKSTEWENKYKKKIPETDDYTTKLINVPHVECVSVDGVPAPVQQKILFQIVSRTTNTANRVVVQLSMEEAVANDIDLTLQDLKKHCAVMLKQINSWLRMIKTQLCHQSIVMDRWNEAKSKLKNINDRDSALSEGGKSATVDRNMKKYEERLEKLEQAICQMCGPTCGTCKENVPTVPQQPGTPGQPPTPYNPGQPPTPYNPGQPPTPYNPGQPPTPYNPGQPPTPYNPGQPPTPYNPGQPQIPCIPGQPQMPCIPGQPQMPCIPGQPQTPCIPGQPQTPCIPGQPQTPCIPGQPQTPCIPGQPQTPCIPGQPQTPCIPGQPQTPCIPGQPQTPCIPGQPQTPCVPGQPKNPCIPGQSGKPFCSVQPLMPCGRGKPQIGQQDPGCNTQMDPYNQRLRQIEEAARIMCLNQSKSFCDPIRGNSTPGSPSGKFPSLDPCSPQADNRLRSGANTPYECPVFNDPTDWSQYHYQRTPSGSPLSVRCPSPLADSQPADSRGVQRGRAPPGAFPGVDLVDIGAGYPIPLAVLERQPRQPEPISWGPSDDCATPQMGRFRPLAASSPSGAGSTLRPRETISCIPPNPMEGQPMDPLLPKIQGDLQNLADRNKHLQDLVRNFKKVRATLTDEIDKAVRLNQKLQRDLYYVAESHRT